MALLEEIHSLLVNQTDIEIDGRLSLESSLQSDQLDDPEAYTDGLTSEEALYTSYRDYYQIYQDLKSRKLSSFADLGAGISRSKILFDLLRAPFKSSTYEFVPERVQAAKQAYLKNKELPAEQVTEIHEFNLKVSTLPSHDAYFLYLPVGPTLDNLIEEFKKLSLERARYLYVIESHGDLISYLVESLTQLELVKTYPLFSERHDNKLYVFKLNSSADQLREEEQILKKCHESIEDGFSLIDLKDPSLFTLFRKYQDNPRIQLLIQEDHYCWLASLEGFKSGPTPNTIETVHPPRIINRSDIKLIVSPPELLMPYLLQRQQRAVVAGSQIRKIILKENIIIEYANGVWEEKKGEAWFPKTSQAVCRRERKS